MVLQITARNQKTVFNSVAVERQSELMFPFLFYFQPHVVCGEQLVHSPYMQCLASLAVGLHLDQLLCRPPAPPPLRHCPPESGTAVWCASEWAWLDCFSTTVKAAEALARGATFPESFTVPDLEPVPKDEMALLMVREAAAVCAAASTVGTVIYNVINTYCCI